MRLAITSTTGALMRFEIAPSSSLNNLVTCWTDPAYLSRVAKRELMRACNRIIHTTVAIIGTPLVPIAWLKVRGGYTSRRACCRTADLAKYINQATYWITIVAFWLFFIKHLMSPIPSLVFIAAILAICWHFLVSHTLKARGRDSLDFFLLDRIGDTGE